MVVEDCCLFRLGAGVPKSSGVTNVVAGVEKYIPEFPVISSRDPSCRFAGRPNAELVPRFKLEIPRPNPLAIFSVWGKNWFESTGLRVVLLVVVGVVVVLVVEGLNCCGVIVLPKNVEGVVEAKKEG